MKPMDAFKAAAGVAEKVTGDNPKLLQGLMKLVQNMPGGAAGLVKQFQDKGMGSVASSPTGAGSTLSLSADQILKGFGADKIDALAKSSGLDPKVVPDKLVTLLPKVLETLNPAKPVGVA